MLKLKEKLYLLVHTSKYDGAQNFVTMNQASLNATTVDWSDWEFYEIDSIPSAKKFKLTKQLPKIEYV